MQKTSKITFIEQNRQQPTYLEFNRWDVTFANGEKYIFLSKGGFKKAVGEEATYEVKNQQQGTAKLVRDPQFKAQVFSKGNVQKDDVQKYIIRQSSASSAANFYAHKNADEQEVINLARMIEQFVYNG